MNQLVQSVLCHWATTTRQPPTLTILYMYCTDGTEYLSRTPDSYSVCAFLIMFVVSASLYCIKWLHDYDIISWWRRGHRTSSSSFIYEYVSFLKTSECSSHRCHMLLSTQRIVSQRSPSLKNRSAHPTSSTGGVASRVQELNFYCCQRKTAQWWWPPTCTNFRESSWQETNIHQIVV